MFLKRWVLITFLIFGVTAPAWVYSQEISHVQFKLNVPDKEVLIIYDLYDPQEKTNDVMVQASNDQGKTWTVFPSPVSLYGDVHGVKPGKEKSIVWKAGDNFQNFSVELFQVRLLLVQVVGSASSASIVLDPTTQATREAGNVEKENQLELDHAKSLPQTMTSKDGATLVLIPAGYFTMGSSKGRGERDEHPAHHVWVSSFYMDQYLVTFDQYDKFCDATGRQKPSDGYDRHKFPPTHFGRGRRPVFNLTWKAAEAYCKWAGGRLPTEAEWEKASRGGTESTYFWGEDTSPIAAYAWFGGDSRYQIWPVGELKPNPYGLYDIVGNLWQWVSDWYSADDYANSSDRNPAGPPDGKLKVLRGGSFSNGDDCLQVAHRSSWDPDKEDGAEMMGHLHEHGFRCVIPADEK